MKKNQKVSIICVTFNQEKYIKQALESFVGQKTNFDFEVVIGDDCSTDKTADIIRQFEEKYPHIIRPIFREKNIGTTKNFFDIFSRANGEYISICDGDDFFTNDNKLQKQVDFLEVNRDFSMCFHPARWFFENNEEPDSIYPDIKNGADFTVERLLEENFINTNSVMYRRQSYVDLPKENILPGDWFIHLYHAKFGKIGFINRVMSAYRRHSGGLWWNSYKSPDELIKKHGGAHLAMYFELLKIYNNDQGYKNIIFNNIYELFRNFARIDKEDGIKLVEKILVKYPIEMADLLVDFWSSGSDKKDVYCQPVQLKSNEIEKIKQEVEFIKSSKFWKLRNKYLKFKNIWNSAEKE
ncbi:MAG: hypothetical protein UT50_C0001G0093 [Candidatus Moranbacteria bacterium GW2011_GWA2_39_41]|nr:MAG: hypothetical protein UT50_C0001G0093 [Candidatus Moranbacteria bacterium GW2011_GWA2_39_41]